MVLLHEDRSQHCISDFTSLHANDPEEMLYIHFEVKTSYSQ